MFERASNRTGFWKNPMVDQLNKLCKHYLIVVKLANGKCTVYLRYFKRNLIVMIEHGEIHGNLEKLVTCTILINIIGYFGKTKQQFVQQMIHD